MLVNKQVCHAASAMWGGPPGPQPTPWSARPRRQPVDAWREERDDGVPRGPGGPPHELCRIHWAEAATTKNLLGNLDGLRLRREFPLRVLHYYAHAIRARRGGEAESRIHSVLGKPREGVVF